MSIEAKLVFSPPVGGSKVKALVPGSNQSIPVYGFLTAFLHSKLNLDFG